MGDKNNREYQDVVGKPLAEGDIIMYATASSSSVNINFSVIEDIIDLDSPAYLTTERCEGTRYGRRVESWDLAFKLRVRRVERVRGDEFRDEFTWPTKWAKDPITGDYGHVPGSREDTKLQTIHKVERVVKVDVSFDGR